jgi:hypothetical protein
MPLVLAWIGYISVALPMKKSLFNVHKLELSIFEKSSLCAEGFIRNSAVCAKTEHRSGDVHNRTMSIGAEIFVQTVHFWKVLAADAEFFD